MIILKYLLKFKARFVAYSCANIILGDKMKRIFLTSISIILTIFFAGCTSAEPKKSNIEQTTFSATNDVAVSSAVEPAKNVNLMRYTMNLDEFTDKYNAIMKESGGTEFINASRWKKTGETETDTNGVEFNYYYYNASNLNFTATVEKETNKIMNIGCGTAMSVFISHDAGKEDENMVLRKSAIMAAAISDYSIDELDLLENIFSVITFDEIDSLWYKGSIFNLSTDKDKENSENNIMLFRVFPTTDKQRIEWNIKDYDTYVSKK